MGDRHDLAEAQPLHDRLKIFQLLLEAVGGAGRFVRGAKAQEIECHDASSAGEQIRDQIVPDMQVVGESVHKHEGGPGASIVSSVEASFARGIRCSENATGSEDMRHPLFLLEAASVWLVTKTARKITSGDFSTASSSAIA